MQYYVVMYCHRNRPPEPYGVLFSMKNNAIRKANRLAAKYKQAKFVVYSVTINGEVT